MNMHEEHRYIASYSSLRYAGNSLYLARDSEVGNGLLISQAQAELLSVVNHPMTVVEMAEELSRSGWVVDDRSYLREQLHTLLDGGLLSTFDAKHLHEKLSAVSGGRDRNDASTDIHLSWVSADRPDTLTESIASFAANLRRYGHSPSIKVYDDSGDPKVQVDYQKRLVGLNKRMSVRISYAGDEEKRRYINVLTEEVRPRGVDRQVVEFIFGLDSFPYTLGANRNAALLDAAGERFVLHDDDAFCRLAPSPSCGEEKRTVLRFSSEPHTYRTERFENLRELYEQIETVDYDYLSLFDGLGSSLHEYLSRGFTSFETEGVSPEFAAHLRNNHGRVLLSTLGFYGDSGKTENTYYLGLLQEEGRGKMYESEETYNRYLSSRAVIRSIDRESIKNGSPFFGLVMGFDHRAPLPPFFSLFRNSDTIFSALLGTCRPQSYRSYLPWMAEHRPSEPRTFSRAETKAVFPLFSDFLLHLHADYRKRYGGEHNRPPLQDRSTVYDGGFGTFLCRVGRLPEKDFREYARHLTNLHLSRQVFFFNGLLEYYGHEPEYWAEDVHSLVGRAREMMSEPSAPVPAELANVDPPDPPDQALTRFREIVGRYGRLIEAWPEIWSAAKELREHGIRVTREL
jgi:hypothetical protein